MVTASSPKAPGMVRIAFDLGGTAFVSFRRNTYGGSAEGHHGVVVEGLTVDEVFDALRKRQDVFDGTAACCQTAERKRRARSGKARKYNTADRRGASPAQRTA